MRRISRRSVQAGFTLVEMLVIIPVVVVIVTGLIVAIVSTTGSSMVTTARSQLQNDVLAALDRIEADIKLSLDVSGSLPHQITLSNLATNGNPFSISRKLIQRSNCQAVADNAAVAISDALQYQTSYSVTPEKTLIRHTSYNCGSASDDDVWQLNNDREKIIDSVKDVRLEVTKVSGGALKVQITATRHVAGRDIDFSGQVFVRSINY